MDGSGRKTALFSMGKTLDSNHVPFFFFLFFLFLGPVIIFFGREGKLGNKVSDQPLLLSSGLP